MNYPRRVNTNNKFTSIEIACLMVIGGFFYFISFESGVVSAPGITVYVDDDNILGPWDGSLANPYKTIQDGVNNAIDGDTVFVYSGIYLEHVVVNKTINLTGENRDTTIIDGRDIGDVVTINVNWVNITGFTVTGNGTLVRDGIKLSNVDNCKVIYNNVSSNKGYGIILISSNGNNIINNRIYQNQIDGISLYNSLNNNIISNNISNNRMDGIYLNWSDWNSILNNKVTFNDWGIFLEYSSNNTLQNNICNNNWEYGIKLEDESHWNNIIGNTASNNRQGISFLGAFGRPHGNYVSYNNASSYNNSSNNYFYKIKFINTL
jgi:parallel beta-helix repeat protein